MDVDQAVKLWLLILWDEYLFSLPSKLSKRKSLKSFQSIKSL